MASLPFYTPLRYPGGKGKLAPFIKAIFEANHLLDGQYAEPYAGGAAVGLELLFHEYVSHIYINDVNPSLGAFWRCVLDQPEELSRLIHDTPVTMEEWERQRNIQSRVGKVSDLRLAFSTFFLNRTNRSGILCAGVIGGKNQDGPWKMDARYNTAELTRRIHAIAAQRGRISFSQQDAATFIRAVAAKMPSKSLVYLDPPYYVKGKELYLHHYVDRDHEKIANLVADRLVDQNWIVSYDNVPYIRALYRGLSRRDYLLSYSAQDRYKGTEVMFFSEWLKVPPLVAPMKAAA